jgi:hypothetical protein
MLNDKDERKSQRVMQAMLQMHKIDIKRLEQAYKATDKPVKTGKHNPTKNQP